MNNILENISNEEDELKDKYLTFRLGNELYGLDIKYVTEIIRIQTITQVPNLPEYIIGIINLRGKIFPIIDIRIRFKKNARDYDEKTCIIVVEIENICLGFVVDIVSEVVNIEIENIEMPQIYTKSNLNSYIQGIAKVNNDVILILNCMELINSEDVSYA